MPLLIFFDIAALVVIEDMDSGPLQAVALAILLLFNITVMVIMAIAA